MFWMSPFQKAFLKTLYQRRRFLFVSRLHNVDCDSPRHKKDANDDDDDDDVCCKRALSSARALFVGCRQIYPKARSSFYVFGEVLDAQS